MFAIRPIRDEKSYDAALAQAEHYFDYPPEPGSSESDQFEMLIDLISAYEIRRWPIMVDDPIEFLTEAMTLLGKTQADFAALIGSRSRASEILNRKRHMTLGHIHAISTTWNLPADLLVVPYKLSA
jgi:HTH-type transcriptional regulator / antitoxin HigA